MTYRNIIVGLGNPGRTYRGTRHNAGAALVEFVARAYRIPLELRKYHSIIGRGNIAGRECLLTLPQTYMNRSGVAVRRTLAFTHNPVASLIVAHDDLDLPLGRIRLRAGGGAGGHRGVGSMIESLGSGDFIRLKIGIGRPPAGLTSEEYVLDKFTARERELLAKVLERSVRALDTLVAEGLEKAMSLFNAPRREDERPT